MVMILHFVNQYGANRALPLMLLPERKGGLGPAGTFWFFVSMTAIGLVWAWFFIPETAGLPLEQLDKLFTLKWYEIGRKGSERAKREIQIEDREKERAKDEQAKGDVSYIETGKS